MNKKLEIGDKIVIYPRKDLSYKSLETKNGIEYQEFDSSNFPGALTAVFIGRKKGKDGKWYERYTLKTIPQELLYFSLYGKRGFENLIEELNKISEILQGTAEDGRKILYSRSINIEDVNEILGVVVDYKNKRIYQKNDPSKDINKVVLFGERRKILPFEAEECSAIDFEFIKENQLELTAYSYSIEDLKISKKRKEIVQLNVGYHLASRSVYVDSSNADFCEGAVNNGRVHMGGGLFYSDGDEYRGCLAVRPVFYLECDIQSDYRRTVGRKGFFKRKVETKKEKITKMQEDLNKEEKELEKMLEKVLKLV